MSENNQKPKVRNPKAYQPIDGIVPFCPYCGAKFVEPVAVNCDYTCPACNELFNVVRQSKEDGNE